MRKIQLTDGTEMTLDELASPDPYGTPYVITLLRERRLNPEDVLEELLPLKDRDDTSVLDMCIKRFKEPLSDDDGKIVPRALFLANKPGCRLPLHFRNTKEILLIAREDGWSVAHEMAFHGFLPESAMTEDILKLTNTSGCSVAYNAAWYKHFPDWAKKRRDILLLRNGSGTYVAHVLARWGKLPSEMMTEDLLQLQDQNGCTLAYNAAWHDSFPDWAKKKRNILLLENGQGDYVIHILAWKGELPVEMMTPDILHFENKNGIAVLFAIVSGKQLSQEILLLPWDEKRKVFEYLLSKQARKNKNLQDEEKIFYVKEQIMKLIQKQLILELSVNCNDWNEMER